jgi:hypothetical protein
MVLQEQPTQAVAVAVVVTTQTELLPKAVLAVQAL